MRRLIITIALLIAIISPKVIAAQVETTPVPLNVRTLVKERIEANKETREDIRLKIEEKTATREAAKEELRAKLEVKRQERIRTLFGNLITRTEAAIKRLYTLIERMEARLAIFEKEGESVTEIQAEIESAKTLLEDAEASLASAIEGLSDVIASDDPRVGFVYVKDIIKDIKLTLTDAHSILVQVIGDMKGLRVGATDNL